MTKRASAAAVVGLVVYVAMVKAATIVILTSADVGDHRFTSGGALSVIGWASAQLVYLGLASLLILRRRRANAVAEPRLTASRRHSRWVVHR